MSGWGHGISTNLLPDSVRQHYGISRPCLLSGISQTWHRPLLLTNRETRFEMSYLAC